MSFISELLITVITFVKQLDTVLRILTSIL
jgi:hypothetical protein